MEKEPKNIEADPNREAWEATLDRTRELKETIWKELERIYGGGHVFGEWQKIMARWRELVGYESDLKKFVAYHEATSSTTDYNRAPYADLPDEKSIIKYLEKTLEELKTK